MTPTKISKFWRMKKTKKRERPSPPTKKKLIKMKKICCGSISFAVLLYPISVQPSVFYQFCNLPENPREIVFVLAFIDEDLWYLIVL